MFDNETNDYSLDDCSWWGVPDHRKPWFVKPDCAGRIGDTELGVMCEVHYNAAKAV